ncbi:hypothetical protein FOL47_001869 [Perkinsus chesapeaki]|uniref:Uncharacterized protein n=1 Tax=Perkinsus chesapeaki TaxID=330153 RepID=A0A7J6MHP5_PERCH|nr:hypothetical protein FOL47_001869 [Perkinsus chesapeaki]
MRCTHEHPTESTRPLSPNAAALSHYCRPSCNITSRLPSDVRLGCPVVSRLGWLAGDIASTPRERRFVKQNGFPAAKISSDYYQVCGPSGKVSNSSMVFSFIALSSVTFIAGSASPFPEDYGNFVYTSSGPDPVVVSFSATKDGHGTLSIGSGQRTYNDGPFPLVRDPESIEYGAIYEPVDGYNDPRPQEWLDGAREIYPHLDFQDQDFASFSLDNDGNLETEIEGEYTTLKREWLPLSPGRYMTDSSKSQYTIQYDIHPDNAVYVRFGCSSGDTGYMIYKLVSQGPGKEYKLTAYPGRNTVDDLVTKFKTVCPASADSFDFESDFITVGFATPDIDPEEIEFGEIHSFPEFDYDVRHQTWLAHARWACPHLEIDDQDFRFFNADNDGNLETELAGEYTVLEREWLPLSRGRYMTDPTKAAVHIQYDVLSSDFAYVRFGCDTGTTGYMPYRLVSQGPGKLSKLMPYPGRSSVDDLVRQFKRACPVWADSFDFDGNFRTVGAATPDVLYAFGDYIYDRLVLS